MINRRRAEAGMLPSGKANLAAASNRKGVVGVTAPGAGMVTLPIVLPAVHRFFVGAGAVAPSSKMNLS